jgi:hypothetical protein
MACGRKEKLIQVVRGKTYRKRPHGIPRPTWEYNIKMASGILMGICGMGSHGSMSGG